jgi:hypothetical protein
MKAGKKYLMAQELQGLYLNKKLNRFCFVGIYKTEYYTIKYNDNKNESIETRIMVLGCGNQLGFDLVDKFLKKYYMSYSRRVLFVDVLSRFLAATMQLYTNAVQVNLFALLFNKSIFFTIVRCYFYQCHYKF